MRPGKTMGGAGASRPEKISLRYIAVLCIFAPMPSKELVAASSRPLLLSILAEGESYGYAIIQRVKELSGGKLEWSDGMLYPVLHRLEAEGLIQSEWREAETGRERKYYRLKKEGRSALRTAKSEWLSVHQILAHLWNPHPA
jgi:PadR family transcriptional regulator